MNALTEHYVHLLEQFLKQNHAPFSAKWFMFIHRIPRSHIGALSFAFRILSQEGKIKRWKDSKRLWIGNGGVKNE